MGDSRGEGSDSGKSGEGRPGRSWTERFRGSIRYRRFTDLDLAGRPSIFFKFDLDPGQTELPPGVYEILHGLKHLPPSAGHSKPCPTHLEFTRSKKHGRVWRLPDNDTGRLTADLIDVRLNLLARKLDGPEVGGR